MVFFDFFRSSSSKLSSSSSSSITFIINPFEDSEITVQRVRRSARSSGALDAPSRSKLARSRLQRNFQRPRRHFERAASLEHGRPASILSRPDSPGVDFQGRNASIFVRFCCASASVLTSSDVNKTPLKLMRNAHRCFRAAKQKRRKIDPKARSTAPGAPQAIGRRTKRLLERLCGGSKTLLDGSWSLLARPGRPLIGLGATFWRPKTVPSASGRVPEMALGAQTGP